MNITDKDEFYGMYNATLYCEDSLFIESVANIDTSIAYFIIYNKVLDKSVRLSILEPEYIDYGFKLDSNSIDFIYRALNSKYWNTDMTVWEKIIYDINDARKTEELGNIIKNIPIPNYRLLLEKE